MVDVNILVCVPQYEIYADLIATVFCILLKIILLASDGNSTQTASAKRNFMLSTEYAHGSQDQRNNSGLICWLFWLYFSNKFSL